MPKDTKSLGNNKAPACESRGFVHKKRGVHFDTPPYSKLFQVGKENASGNGRFFPCFFLFYPSINSLIMENYLYLCKNRFS